LPGSLYLVATPIGNLDDITLRALRVLRDEISLIACEDTRQTQKLLQHFEIRKPLVSYHEHNEAQRSSEIIAALARGESVALVSDAGTPLVSDPGYRVVSEAIRHEIPVVPIPGASALLAALTASGLPVHEFRFAGFLPPKALARRKMLESLAQETTTIVAYEKVHEEFLRGSAAAILKILEARGAVKGEITLIISPAQEAETGEPLEEVAKLTAAGIERMEAIKTVAKRLGLPKREVYRRVTEPDNSRPDKHRD
jgi:16S rRNA (cytidine1402-2'-O)-methyltransferase